MKIIATMAEAAEIIRKCERRHHACISSACRDCVLMDVCGLTGELPTLFVITAPEGETDDE